MSQDPLLFSTEERRRRQEAVDYATASVELSSFKIDAFTQERCAPLCRGSAIVEGVFGKLKLSFP